MRVDGGECIPASVSMKLSNPSKCVDEGGRALEESVCEGDRREKVLYWQPAGLSPLYHRDD